MSNMKRVTKDNLITLANYKKEYLKKEEMGIKDEELLLKINNYIDDVINKDSSYFSKLIKYDFDSETLNFLMA